MKTLNALVAFGIIAFATNEASAQSEVINSKPVVASSLTGGKEVKNYPHNHNYFLQRVVTGISGYSNYYDFSKTRDEIVVQINEIKNLEDSLENQNIIDEKIYSTRKKMLWMIENLVTIQNEMNLTLKNNQVLAYLFRYPLADIEYRVLLRRAQAAAGAGITDPFEKEHRIGTAQDKLQLDIMGDFIKYYEFYLYFLGAANRDISEVCIIKNRVC